MTEHDVLAGYRLCLFTLADELGHVSQACRPMGSIARPTVGGSARLTGGGSRRCGSESAAGRGCPTRSARIWSSGSSPSASLTLGSVRGGSRLSWRGRSGAGCGSQNTASGGSCAGVGLNTRGLARSRCEARNGGSARPLVAHCTRPLGRLDRPLVSRQGVGWSSRRALVLVLARSGSPECVTPETWLDRVISARVPATTTCADSRPAGRTRGRCGTCRLCGPGCEDRGAAEDFG
jgi:hypothetical protein